MLLTDAKSSQRELSAGELNPEEPSSPRQDRIFDESRSHPWHGERLRVDSLPKSHAQGHVREC